MRRLWLKRPHVAFPKRHRPRQRIGRGRRPRGGTFARRRRSSHDVRLDDDVARAADHEKVLDIVTAHQDKAASAINVGLIDYCQSRLAPPSRRISQTLAAEPAQKPKGQCEDAKDDNKGDQHLNRILALAK
jgi:hypothetical protein